MYLLGCLRILLKLSNILASDGKSSRTTAREAVLANFLTRISKFKKKTRFSMFAYPIFVENVKFLSLFSPFIPFITQKLQRWFCNINRHIYLPNYPTTITISLIYPIIVSFLPKLPHQLYHTYSVNLKYSQCRLLLLSD